MSTRKTVQVPLSDATRSGGRVTRIEDGATVGATIGKNLYLPSGNLAKPEDILNAMTGGAPGGATALPWRSIREIPADVVALAETDTVGIYVITANGESATRAILGVNGEIVIQRGDGVEGSPLVGLADVENGGGGTLQLVDIDAKGRVIGSSDATARVREIDGTVLRIAVGAIGGHRVVRSAGQAGVEYASADAADHGDDTLGVTVEAATDGGDVVVRILGPLEFNGWAWVPGLPVFLSTGGGLTQEAPDGAGGEEFAQIMGHAESPTVMHVNPQPPIYL